MKFKVEKQYSKYCIYIFLTTTVVASTYLIISNINYIIGYFLHIVFDIFKVLFPLNIALVIAYILNQPMMILEKLLAKLKLRNKKMSQSTIRSLSLITIYISVLLLLLIAGNFLFPQIKDNMVKLIANLPEYIKSVEGYISDSLKSTKIFNPKKVDYTNFEKYVGKFSDLSALIIKLVIDNITNFTLSIFNIVLAVFISFYILKDKESFKDYFRVIRDLYFKERNQKQITNILKEIDNILGQFMLGLITESIIVGCLVAFALFLVGYDFAFLTGLIFAVFNVIPYFGAIMAMTITVLLGLMQGPKIAITSLIVIFIIHELDSNIIQPKILGQKVGVEPIWVMVGITVGGSYFGVLGMILAVPAVALIKALLKYIIKLRREKLDIENKKEAD